MRLFVAAAVLWVSVHAALLVAYPPVHADEAWLASSTRAMIGTGSLEVGADIFRITPARPHAIRLLYHFLQAPLVALWWSPGSVRLLSLLCAAVTIGAAAALSRSAFGHAPARVVLVAGLAVDPLLFTASHLARPEIVLVALMTVALALAADPERRGTARTLIVGSVVGLSIGVHANSLLVAFAVGAVYLYPLLRGPHGGGTGTPDGAGRDVRRLALLIGVVAAWAALWFAWSRLLDPEFPRAYAEFGSRYGVSESMIVKLLRLPAFFSRLAHRVGGTYPVPEVGPVLVVGALTMLAALWTMVSVAISAARVRPNGVRRDGPTPPADASGADSARAFSAVAEAALVLVAVVVAMVVIGKYSQTSAVLLVPAFYRLVGALVELASRERALRRPAGVFVAVALVAIAVTTAGSVAAQITEGSSYRRYVAAVREHVPDGARVLASPNLAFAFGPGELSAFTDLDALREAGLSVEKYIDRFGIEYVLYPDELDTIHAERPVWNDLYGNVVPWYRELATLLAERGEVVASWVEPVYAMRIVAYQGDARLTVYRVHGAAGTAGASAAGAAASPGLGVTRVRGGVDEKLAPGVVAHAQE